MASLVVAVVPDVGPCERLVMLWHRLGVRQVVALESVRLHQAADTSGWRDDMPLLPSLRHLVEGEEYRQRTVFAVVEDGFDLEGLLAASQGVLAEGPEMQAGLVFVVPVLRALRVAGRRGANSLGHA